MNLIYKKKGFTLIELIVVIAVLGIIVLLAAPKFLGHAENAKLAQIKNDVEAYEKQIGSMMIKNPDNFKEMNFTITDSDGDPYTYYNFSQRTYTQNNDNLTDFLLDLDVPSGMKIYDETGLVAIMGGGYNSTGWIKDKLNKHQDQMLNDPVDIFTFIVPEVESKLTLEGIFIMNSEGEVFFLQGAKYQSHT